MLPIPPPPRYFVIVFFLEQLQLPSGGSAGSHKKKKLWGLKKCAYASPWDNTKKKIPVLHFPIIVSWKCHIQQDNTPVT